MASNDMILMDLQGLGRSGSLQDRFRWKSVSTKWAAEVAPKVIEEIKREAPVQTGALRDSTRVTVGSRGDRVSLVFSSDVFYAPFVIHGTPPHMIYPRAARMLHWTTGGVDMFAKSVNHPGTRPNDYPGRGTRKVLGDVARVMAEAIQTKK